MCFSLLTFEKTIQYDKHVPILYDVVDNIVDKSELSYKLLATCIIN